MVGWGQVGGTKAFKHFGNVALHGDGDTVLVESDVHAEVGIAGRFDSELVIIRLKSCDKVVRVFLRSIFDAEIVHHETEGDIAGEMFKEAWRVGTLNIAVRLKMRDETKLAETTGLRETVHALADFEVDGVVVEKRFKVVGGYSGAGSLVRSIRTYS